MNEKIDPKQEERKMEKQKDAEASQQIEVREHTTS